MNIIGLTGDENMNQKDIIINEYNTGNYQDKIADFNQKYAEFQKEFAPRALQKLTPDELLKKMCFQAENMDDMAHRLEYNDDFGNIKGNPRAMLEYLLSCDKNGQWRDRREDKNITPRKAETIAEKIRDFLVFAIGEIKKRPLKSVAEYEQLGADLGNKCNELKLPQDFYTHMWVRKYFHMICPDKMPSWYSRGMLNDVIEKLGLSRHKNLYANIGEIALFARSCDMPMIIFSGIVGRRYHQKNDTNAIKESGNTTMTQTKKIPLNQILYGAPGTGKTYSTIIKAMEILDNDGGDYSFYISAERYKKLHTKFNELKKQGQIQFVTFHQSMAYEDFIEGIRPTLDDNQTLGYRRVDGIFKQIADLANNDKSGKKYVLVIDEINRGNISKIFGELITLIEETKRIGANEELTITLPYSQEPFGVPKNLYIIGTMNTADRSIAAIDIALRRRFKFTPVLPDARLIPETVENIKLRAVFNTMNQKINALLDDGHLIGHSFWMKCKSVQDVKNSWFDEIMPLMNEYFFGDWEKLQYVLGADFVKSESVSDTTGQNLIGDDKSWRFVKSDEVSDADFVDYINKLTGKVSDDE